MVDIRAANEPEKSSFITFSEGLWQASQTSNPEVASSHSASSYLRVSSYTKNIESEDAAEINQVSCNEGYLVVVDAS